MNKQEFSKIAIILKAAYPNKPFLMEQAEVDIWFFQAKDLSYAQAQTAAMAWIANEKWPPSIAEFRQAALEAGQDDHAPAAELAWGELQEAVSRFGYYQQDALLASVHPYTRRAAEAVGLDSLLHTDYEHIETLRAQFREAYKVVSSQETKKTNTPPQVEALIEQARLKRLE